MNTPLLTAAVLLLAVPAAASAQSSSPPASAVPRREALRLKFTAGNTLHYTLVEDTEGSYREPRGKLISIKSHLEMQEHETVSDLRAADGAGLIDFGIDSMTVTVDQKPQALTRSDPQALAALAELIVLPGGKLEATIVNPAFDAEEVLTGEDPAHMNPLSALGELPPGPVNAGDTWKSSVFLGMVGEKTAAGSALTAWEAKNGASLAVIKQTLRGTFETPKADPAQRRDMDIQGWTAGTRTLRFSIEAGTVESAESVVLMTVLLTPRGSDGKAAQAPTRMWVKVTSKLTRTGTPAAKVAAPN